MQNQIRFHRKRTAFRKQAIAVWLGVGMLFTLLPAALADDDDSDWRQLHAEVLAGQIKPLRDILESIERDWQGQVIDVDIESADGRRLYEIELLGPQGQVLVLEVDAVDGELIGMDGSNIESMKRR